MLIEFNQIMDNNELYEPFEAFVKGNSFINLYEEYQEYQIPKIKIDSKKCEDEVELMMLNFLINDLNLYLAIHPEDDLIFKKLEQYAKLYKIKKSKYEENYQVIDICDDTNNYSYNELPWPWEVKNV